MPHLSLSLYFLSVSISVDLPPRRFLAARSRPPQLCGIGVSLAPFGGVQESLFLAPGSCCSVGVAIGYFSISLPQFEEGSRGARESYATLTARGVTKWLAVEKRGGG